MGLVFELLLKASLPTLVLPDAQGDALIGLKVSLKASDSQLVDWSPNQVSPCTWSSVTCDANEHVTSVTLQGSYKSGVIPKEFGNLSSQTNLDLESNGFSGAIPSTLSNLQKLQFLILSQNNLTGGIPEWLANLPNLINLWVDSNNLSDQVSELFQLSQYKETT